MSGLRATRRRTLQVGQLFIVPSLLLLWSIYSIWTEEKREQGAIYYWIVAQILGAVIGWWMIHCVKTEVHRKHNIITLPPTQVTLWLVLTIFFVRYAFAHYYLVHPVVHPWIYLADVLIAGVITGIFVGRALKLWCRYENIF